jgi:sigma-70-like protein
MTEAQVNAEAASVDPEPDPEADALLAEQVGDAMQVVLDTLAPAERAAFVLYDVFGYSFEEISAVLGRSGAAVRQLASRARRKVQGVPETASDRAAGAEAAKSSMRFWPRHVVVSSQPVRAARARCRHARGRGRSELGREACL